MSEFKIRARIQVTCWDYSMGGEHYTGEIIVRDVQGDPTSGWSRRVIHKLSPAEARHLNKKDARFGSKYEPGQYSERFETKADLLAAARTLVLRLWPDALLEDDDGWDDEAPAQEARGGIRYR